MKLAASLSHEKHRMIDKDHRKAARAAHLQYICDNKEGIIRHKRGKGLYYSFKSKPLKNKQELARIKKLAIPPSWTNVWICASSSGHIQATGLDLNGRKQYRYHTDWTSLRNETKFHHLLEFGKALPLLRKRTKKDITNSEMTASKVLAAAIQLMEQTYIRVGNNGYEKLYGSYGLTTLKDKHLSVQQGKAQLSFTGKKGIDHNITLRNKKLARILKQCRDIPGKELFQYYDEKGTRRSIDSGMVNTYIKEATGNSFSAKDFRTWAGSLHAIESFRTVGPAASASDIPKNIGAMLDAVSSKLGNSRNICKKYYVHPGLIKMYEENKLTPYFNKNSFPATAGQRGLTASEKLLMLILKKCT
jgi:DNA topoisomerase-1